MDANATNLPRWARTRVFGIYAPGVSDAGSEASLIKSGLASTSSSKRTLTSHDGFLVDADPPPPPADLHVRPPPTYLRVSRAVGGYSTFTSCAPPAAVDVQPATVAAAAVTSRVAVAEARGRQCRVTPVDHVIADVRTLSNGGAGVEPRRPGSDVTDDAVDAPVPGGRVSSTDIKVLSRSVVAIAWYGDGAGNTVEDKNSSGDEIANVNFYAVRP